MSRPKKASTTQARIARFAERELHELVDDLYQRINIKASAVDVLGALVLAARHLPPEVVNALLPAYVERERAERAAEDSDTPD